MNTKMLVSRVWATTGLSFKVKRLIDEKTRMVLENKNPKFNPMPAMEDISKLMSLDWKISRQLWRRFIDLIRYSAVLQQSSRRWLDESTIIAEPDDYDKAVEWFTHLFKNQHLLLITKEQEKLIGIISSLEQATAFEIVSQATFASRSWYT